MKEKSSGYSSLSDEYRGFVMSFKREVFIVYMLINDLLAPGGEVRLSACVPFLIRIKSQTF